MIILGVFIMMALIGSCVFVDSRNGFEIPRYFSASKNRETLEALKSSLELQYDLKEFIVSLDKFQPSFAGLSYSRKCLVLGTPKFWKEISLKQVQGSRVVQNDRIIAVAGKAADVGGAQTIDSRPQKRCKRLTFELFVSDPEIGTLSIPLFCPAESAGLSTQKPEYLDARARAVNWHKLTQKILAHQQRSSQRRVSAPAGRRAVERTLDQQIEALWALVEKGALSQDEFKQRKARLLAAG